MRAMTVIAIAVLAAAVLSPPVAADTDEVISDPGYRPQSELAAGFLKKVGTATMEVYPTIVRTLQGTSFSTESQEQVVTFVNHKGFAKAAADTDGFDPGPLKGQGQQAMFQNDMEVIGKALGARSSDAGYHLVLECLIGPRKPEGYSMFGIHCFVLDSQGRNAFSFLLNSHHQSFVDAHMESAEETTEARDALVEKATQVGLAALAAQIERATAAPE